MGLVAAVLAIFAVVLITVQRRELIEQLEITLRQRADDVVASPGFPTSVRLSSDEDRFVAIAEPDGRVIAESFPVRSSSASGNALVLPQQGRDGFATIDVTLDDEAEPFRVLTRFVSTKSGDVVLRVGESVDDLDETVNALSKALLFAVVLTGAVLGMVLWFVVGRTLRPVETIRAEVAGIGAGDLHRRVPVPNTHDEIARLAETMNAMLDKLERASERQRRFTGDASHELRSPITRMRAEVELALRSRDPSIAQATLQSVLAETQAMEQLTDDLLALARFDDDTSLPRGAAWVPIDLDDVVFEEAARTRATGMRVELDDVSGAHVRGDRGQLARVVRNLLENASRHATTGVSVSLSEVDGEAVLAICDDGPGIPAERRETVFERFARVDEARTQGTGGTGLGLSIVRTIVEAHGGTAMIDDAPSGGARVTVRLPAL